MSETTASRSASPRAARTAPSSSSTKEADSPRNCQTVPPLPNPPKGLNYFGEVPNKDLLRWMFRFLKPVKAYVAITCTYLTLGIAAEICTVRYMGRAADIVRGFQPGVASSAIAKAQGFWHWAVSGTGEVGELRRALLITVALACASAVLRYLKEVSAMKLSMTLVFYLRAAVYDKLQNVGFRFHDVVSTGQLINRSLGDLQNVRSFVQTAIISSLDIVLYVGGYMALILSRNSWVALLSLVPLPFWVWAIIRFSRRLQPASRAVMEAEDQNVSIITENIAGVHVVKAFASQQQETDKYRKNCDVFIDRVFKRIRLFANFTPVMRAIASGSHLSLFFAAAILVIKGKMTIGDFLILGSAMNAILGRLQNITQIFDQYQNAIVSSRRLYEVLMAPPTVPQSDGPIALPEGDGAVKFEHVTFGYDPQRPVLHDISFEVPAGSVVAIVGPTGSGKTTLVSLLARFYHPQQGKITIDGADTRNVSLESLRAEIAFVFQETYLFSESVAGNIAYSRPGLRGGDVEAASRLAQAHEFIENLPKGYDTLLGERGASLSGGQKQRLAIARAVLCNPRILVLDDATAAVDSETEDLIRRGMRFVMQERTTFLIAHRISTVKRANLVIVLENGRISQMGTHEQLMQLDGHYREIAAAQLAGEDGVVSRPSHMDRMLDRKDVAEAEAVGKQQAHQVEEDV